MKKIVTLSIMLSLFMAPGMVVFAQGTATQPTTTEQKVTKTVAATKLTKKQARLECQKEGKKGKELKECVEQKLKEAK